MQNYISTTRTKQHQYFRSGATLALPFRKQALRQLLKAMKQYESQLAEALWQDLHKSYEEAYLTELSIVYGEIRNHLRHLRKWAKPERKSSPLAILPASSRIIKEPLGNTLIIAPWNYPVQLLLNPLVGAISAGCTAMLKPSPYVPNVSRVLTEMIRATFSKEYIAIVEGNREVNQMLLAERWDLIFFTGSPSLGKMVMQAAAKHLTSVILELGGKSPCIIDKSANLEVAAKRVAWGKALNAGQTCIAPDYLMIHEDVKDRFLKLLVKEWKHLLTKDPQKAKHFVRIVNDKALDRLIGYLDNGTIYHGGKYDKAERYLSPTILTDIKENTPVMQEEIFGPIFPVLTFKHLDEVISFVNDREKPLALYYFGTNDKHILRHTSSGGTCINDVIMHIVNHKVPFGGVGNSGMGSYHGKDSFLAFSHRRSVIKTPTWVDMPFRYMPYKLFALIKRMV
ncbi:MAG: aldehyde dehydrogenase [Paludibacteraceae bacterium]|nr:aldehyde dehydrogenase [Paludibacteraceae bacterium]